MVWCESIESSEYTNELRGLTWPCPCTNVVITTLLCNVMCQDNKGILCEFSISISVSGNFILS